jgi:hypothetical protein
VQNTVKKKEKKRKERKSYKRKENETSSKNWYLQITIPNAVCNPCPERVEGWNTVIQNYY